MLAEGIYDITQSAITSAADTITQNTKNYVMCKNKKNNTYYKGNNIALSGVTSNSCGKNAEVMSINDINNISTLSLPADIQSVYVKGTDGTVQVLNLGDIYSKAAIVGKLSPRTWYFKFTTEQVGSGEETSTSSDTSSEVIDFDYSTPISEVVFNENDDTRVDEDIYDIAKCSYEHRETKTLTDKRCSGQDDTATLEYRVTEKYPDITDNKSVVCKYKEWKKSTITDDAEKCDEHIGADGFKTTTSTTKCFYYDNNKKITKGSAKDCKQVENKTRFRYQQSCEYWTTDDKEHTKYANGNVDKNPDTSTKKYEITDYDVDGTTKLGTVTYELWSTKTDGCANAQTAIEDVSDDYRNYSFTYKCKSANALKKAEYLDTEAGETYDNTKALCKIIDFKSADLNVADYTNAKKVGAMANISSATDCETLCEYDKLEKDSDCIDACKNWHIESNIFSNCSKLGGGKYTNSTEFCLGGSLAYGETDSENMMHGLAVKETYRRYATPLILDLKNNGFKFTSVSDGAFFDLNADGIIEKTAWTPVQTEFDDAFLWLDKNRNGKADNGAELFGDQNGAPNGFYELAKYDSNNDKVINKDDKIYAKLRLWVDFNANAKVDKGEVKTLPEAGVTELNLAYHVEYDKDGNIKTDMHGNQTGLVGSFKQLVENVVNGVKTVVEKIGTMIDVIFRTT